VRKVRYTTASRYDIINAADFYKAESPIAEKRFFDDIERTAALLLEFPALGQRYRGGTHRLRLHDFPYFLYYVILSDGIRIIAVAHQAQHPRRWDSRLR
jgi:plasmid stabilization system protein ParE